MLKDAIDLTRVKRALVIKLRHHGDVLLSSPVFSVLKNHAQHIEIDALVYHDTRDMITLHPAVSEVFTIDRNWKKLGLLGQARVEWGLLQELKGRGYQLIVVLNDHNRAAAIVRYLKPIWSVAPDLPWHGHFFRKSFTHLHARVPGNTRHTVAAHLDALRRLGVHPSSDEQQLSLVAGVAAEHRISTFLQEAGLGNRPFILVHPGSRWFFKCWPVERMAALLNQLIARGEHIVLTGAPAREEAEMIAAIRQQLTQPVTDFSGKLSLKELAVLIGRARLFVGVDSVPMHMAAAMQTPAVALFGPTLDKVWGPWQSPHRLVMADMPCRPCDRRGCGGSERSDCIEQIEVGRVLASIDDMLRETT